MIISCGMGGSGFAGKLLSLARADVVVHEDWDLPAGVTRDDRVICTSWSGNTAETISSYDAARADGIPVSVITAGGTLAEKARVDGVPLTLLSDTKTPPRQNAVTMTRACFDVLGMTSPFPEIDTAAVEASGAELAHEIGTKIPVFYAPYPLRYIADFFKILTNEDAKRHSWAGSLPSIEHNELAGWTGSYQDSIVPVLIRTTDERPRDTRDLDALVAVLTKMRYTVLTIQLAGATTLAQALYGYAAALRAGWHMATAAHIDPVDTTLIEEFKRLKTR